MTTKKDAEAKHTGFVSASTKNICYYFTTEGGVVSMNEMKMESAYWVSIPVKLLEDESLPHAALRLYGIIGSLT